MSETKQSYQALVTECAEQGKLKKSYWRILPWTGLGSLLLALCCGAAALIIGLASNTLPQDSWRLQTGVVQPSVLLSLVATLANALLRVAFMQGAATAWWLQAGDGVSVGRLSALYEHAYSFQGLFTCRTFSRVTLAAIGMLLLLADGPLLQRAISSQPASHRRIINMTVPVSSSPLTLGATGVITGHDEPTPELYTSQFSQVVQRYNSRQPISLPGFASNGTISMELVAPGWDISCNQTTSTYSITSSGELYRKMNLNQTVQDTQQMFNISVDFIEPSQMQINTAYKSTSGLNGTMSWRMCIFAEALIRYPLQVDNGVVALQSMPLSQNRTVYIIGREDEEGGWGGYPSTLGGFWIALNHLYQTSATIRTDPVGMYTLENGNAVANQYVDPETAGGFATDASVVTWTDPMNDIIASANELALRAAIGLTRQSAIDAEEVSGACATCKQPEIFSPNMTTVNRTTSQLVRATVTTSNYVYQTDFAWLMSGCAIILVACILVAPMYWGWWELGRCYTMNPLETAKAFDAPVLRGISPYTPATEWTRSQLQMRIRYGKGWSGGEDAMISQSMLDDQRDKTMSGVVVRPQVGHDGQSSMGSYEGGMLHDARTCAVVSKFYKIA